MKRRSARTPTSPPAHTHAHPHTHTHTCTHDDDDEIDTHIFAHRPRGSACESVCARELRSTALRTCPHDAHGLAATSVRGCALAHACATMKRPFFVHDWERPSWRKQALVNDGGDTESYPEPTPEDCVDNFVSMLVELNVSGGLSAKSVCILAYWASGFFPSDTLNKFGMKPGSSSGHYHLHLGNLLGFKDNRENLYQLEVPGHRRHDFERTTFVMPSVPAQEALAREIERDPSLTDRLREAKAGNALPKAFPDHPIAQRHNGIPSRPLRRRGPLLTH